MHVVDLAAARHGDGRPLLRAARARTGPDAQRARRSGLVVTSSVVRTSGSRTFLATAIPIATRMRMMSSFFIGIPLRSTHGSEIGCIVGACTSEQSRGNRGHDLDGDAVDRGVVRQHVDEVRPARAGCCSRPRARGRPTGGCPGLSWPQPCGRDTTPGIISSLTSTGTSTLPASRRDAGRLAVDEADARRVVGVDEQRAAVLALHEHLHVVHPRVVRAQVAAAHEHERRRRSRLEARRAAAGGRR